MRAVAAALAPLSETAVSSVAALLDIALSESSNETLKLLEILLLFSVSDSEAAVDAEADLLSLAAALALSLELARWLARVDSSVEAEVDSSEEGDVDALTEAEAD